MSEIISDLVDRKDLSSSQMRAAMQEIMMGQFSEAQAAAFLVGLRIKGETAEEIANAVQVLRQHMVQLDSGRPDVLDTCGTGGDHSGTFNISTAVAFVVAGAGVPVVKHGNRSVSSRSGSADVLAELGVKIDLDAGQARCCLDRANLAFCFAPRFHPALKHIAPIRRQLGVPTLFNCLGPLANPAGANRQLLGVGKVELLEKMAQALIHLKTTHALVVHSTEGLDEVSLSAPTLVIEVQETRARPLAWSHEDFGLDPCNLSDLRVECPQASAALILRILKGEEQGSPLRVVLANAAAAFLAADKVTHVKEGVALAKEILASGMALETLEKLKEASGG